jgi:hypothetical protein
MNGIKLGRGIGPGVSSMSSMARSSGGRVAEVVEEAAAAAAALSRVVAVRAASVR